MRKIYDYLIAGFVFLSAMFYVSGRNFHQAQNDMFHIVAPAIIACMFCLKPVRFIKNYWISAFTMLALASILSMKANRAIAIEQMVNITLVLGLFYAFANYVEDRKPIYQAIFWVMILNFIMVVLQYFKVDPLCLDDTGQKNIRHLVGMFGHPMNLGIYSSLALPIFADRYKKWLWVPIICLLASKSFYAIPVGFIALLLYFIKTSQKKCIIITMLSGAIGIGIILLQVLKNPTFVIENKILLRIYLYKEMLMAAFSSGSFFGYGPGSFVHVVQPMTHVQLPSKEIFLGSVLEPWNEYIGWFIQLGPASLFIISGLIWGFLRQINKVTSTESIALYCSLATIPIGICFHSYTYFVNTGVISLVILSLFHITKEEAC